MKRSTGVTASAILVFLGSGITLIFGALMVFVVLFVPKQPPPPPFIHAVLAFSVVVYLAFGIWGIASGVGLLLLRQWARISMLIFSVILLVFTVPALLIVPFLPLPGADGQPDNFALIFKIGIGVVYGAIAAIGAGWLYFFNKKTVKEQFQRPPEPGTAEVLAFAAKPSRRPLSITIIGCLLLLGPLFLVPMMFMNFPMLFLGRILEGWSASLLVLAWSVAQGAAGIGLLRLKPWARILAIATFLFGMLNCLALALPGSMARMEQANAAVQARMGIPTATVPGVLAIQHAVLWVGVIGGMASAGIQLWFVVTRKQAFLPDPETTVLNP